MKIYRWYNRFYVICNRMLNLFKSFWKIYIFKKCFFESDINSNGLKEKHTEHWICNTCIQNIPNEIKSTNFTFFSFVVQTNSHAVSILLKWTLKSSFLWYFCSLSLALSFVPIEFTNCQHILVRIMCSSAGVNGQTFSSLPQNRQPNSFAKYQSYIFKKHNSSVAIGNWACM